MTLALVTGGAGFLGRHVVQQLGAAGIMVRVLDLQPPPEDMPSSRNMEWCCGDVTDAECVASALKGATHVVHLAAIPHLWTRNVADFERVNHTGAVTVLSAARSAGVRVVHVSSLTTRISGHAGGAVRMVTEDDVPPLDAMLGPYPRSKWAAEQAMRQARAAGDMVQIAIPTMPLGPGDDGFTPPTRMVLDYVSGRTPAYLESWMNIGDVRDMAADIIALLDVDAPPTGVFVGGENIRMSDFLHRLEKVSGVKMPRMRVPGVVAQTFAHLEEAMSTHVTKRPPKAPLTGVRLARRPVTFDMSRAQKLFGRASRPLDQTLVDLLAWFEREGHWAR